MSKHAGFIRKPGRKVTTGDHAARIMSRYGLKIMGAWHVIEGRDDIQVTVAELIFVTVLDRQARLVCKPHTSERV